MVNSGLRNVFTLKIAWSHVSNMQRQVFSELLESVVTRHEVGFRVYFDQHAKPSVVVHVGLDDALFCHAVRFLGCGGNTLLTQVIGGLTKVATVLQQRLTAILETSSSCVTKFFYLLVGYFNSHDLLLCFFCFFGFFLRLRPWFFDLYRWYNFFIEVHVTSAQLGESRLTEIVLIFVIIELGIKRVFVLGEVNA